MITISVAFAGSHTAKTRFGGEHEPLNAKPTLPEEPSEQFEKQPVGHVHGPDCRHDHDDHSHGPQKVKPGERFKNPLVRALVNFLGWFQELFSSFWKDITGKTPDLDSEHHDHDHHDHAEHKH